MSYKSPQFCQSILITTSSKSSMFKNQNFGSVFSWEWQKKKILFFARFVKTLSCLWSTGFFQNKKREQIYCHVLVVQGLQKYFEKKWTLWKLLLMEWTSVKKSWTFFYIFFRTKKKNNSLKFLEIWCLFIA